MDRRNFFRKSLMATSGLVLAPLYISCSYEDLIDNITIDPDEHIEASEFEIRNFNWGVASFDPTADSVIIWTRFDALNKDVNLVWEIATDPAFENLVKRGVAEAKETYDFTVSIDVQGLASNSKFYYRFVELETKSITVVGETITLPSTSEAINKITLAVASCANYAAGLFNVYNAMANSNADVIVHLGDYIYEYGDGEYGTNENTDSLGRNHFPANEITTLNEYRERYKQYRSDENLQLAHQKKPFICVWDDHEIANDAYTNGAENHQANEGSYEVRKQEAIRAYSEFIPVRTNNPSIIYRSFNFGNLMSLHMLDTRIIGRDKQVDYFDFINTNGEFDTNGYSAAVLETDRNMLGDTQFSWLSNQLGNGTTWQVLGQQTLMARMYIPAELLAGIGKAYAEVAAFGSPSDETIADFAKILAELTTLKARLVANDPTLTQPGKDRVLNVVPYNPDAWDGYDAEREKLLKLFKGKKVINLAGDTHNAWFTRITDENGEQVATEFATASVTSPGFEGFIGDNPLVIGAFEKALDLLIDDLSYVNASKRGFLTVAFTQASAEAKWHFINTLTEENYSSYIGKSATIS